MSAALRVLCLDDEVLALRRLELLLGRMADVEVVGTARSGPDALDAIARLRPDVVLLDIRMSGMSGLDVAEAIAESDRPRVIFVTAFDVHAARAFDLNAVDYVLKPVEASRLEAALGRARERLAADDAQSRVDELRAVVAALRADRMPAAARGLADIWVQKRGEFVRLRVDDIDWIEAERDYVRLHAGGDTYLLRHTLGGLQARLGGDRFLRVRRSALVRKDRVRALRKAGYGDVRVRLASGEELRVGRTYVKAFGALLSLPAVEPPAEGA